MDFEQERELAERGLADEEPDHDGLPHAWPPAAKRIHEARARLGLSEVEAADRLGVGLYAYGDLEAHNDEVFTALSLEQLRLLGEVLRVPPRVLLLGERAPAPQRKLTFAEIGVRLANYMAAERLNVGELAERVGWDVDGVLSNPKALWEFNVQGLYDICKVIGLDWVTALPETAASHGAREPGNH